MLILNLLVYENGSIELSRTFSPMDNENYEFQFDTSRAVTNFI